MSLETATYIDSLVITNPDGGDQASTLDDHIRLLKACLQRTFPNVAGAVSASHGALNLAAQLVGSGAQSVISATWSYSVMPQMIVGGVAYDLQGSFGAQIDPSGTFGSTVIAGWSSTYTGTAYRIFHPLNRQPWGDRMAVAIQTGSALLAGYLTSASLSSYVEYSTADLSGSHVPTRAWVLINTW